MKSKSLVASPTFDINRNIITENLYRSYGMGGALYKAYLHSLYGCLYKHLTFRLGVDEYSAYEALQKGARLHHLSCETADYKITLSFSYPQYTSMMLGCPVLLQWDSRK